MATRTALVTGASRGLGLALAEALAARGWQLLIDARGGAALERARARLAEQGTVVAIAGDVADPAHQKALADAAGRLGGLDLVVNNAGALGPTPLPTLLDLPISDLATLFQVNTLAPLALLQRLQGQIRPHATIINISSDAAVRAYPGWGGYGASKSALDHLTAVLTEEETGWRFYSVDPGDMRTDMHQAAFPGEDISDRPLPAESVPGFLALIEGHYPAGRYEARALAGLLEPA